MVAKVCERCGVELSPETARLIALGGLRGRHWSCCIDCYSLGAQILDAWASAGTVLYEAPLPVPMPIASKES